MKVTVITICKNAEELISPTVESVINQSYNQIEYLVIDGKSEDKTLEILKKFRSKNIRIISEKDKGIYDAMNKGISLSAGEIICFMNAGDKFHDKNAVERIVKRFEEEKVDGIFGDVILLNESGQAVGIKKQAGIGDSFLMNDSICHQSMFMTAKLFKKCGLFDLRYPIAADFEWYLRAIKKNNATIKHVDITVADYLLGGFSSNKEKYDKERKEIISLYYSWPMVIYYKFLSKFNRVSKFYQKAEVK